MGWNPIKAVIKAIEKVITKTVDAAVAPVKVVVDVVEGKPVDDALKDALEAQTAPIVAGADLGATIIALQNTVTQQVVSGIAGPGAADIVADLQRLSQPIDPQTAASIIKATEQFVLTGDLNNLNPAAVLMAAEVERCRNLLYPIAAGIPVEVTDKLPDEFRAYAQDVHVMRRADVPGTLNAPSIAIKHLQKASAMTLMDVIVFETIPGSQSEDELFFWCHELQHVHQYKSKGVIGFCKEFIGEELGFKAKDRSINALEADADYVACRHYPAAKPFYIDACPI